MSRPTALITGASSGLGAEFARRLAGRGFDLVLVARREDRLKAIAAELSGAAVEVLPADLCDPAALERVAARAAEISTLELLINNAGFGIPGSFAETDNVKQVAMGRLQVIATLRLCGAALPGMIARGRGAIINVSSLAALFRAPGNANYCACKMFLNAFSEALALDLAGTGVRVQALCPGFTYTEFHSTPEYAAFSHASIPKAFWMDAGAVAAASLAALDRGKVIVVPGLKNRLIAAFAKSGLASLMMKAFPAIRRRNLRRKK